MWYCTSTASELESNGLDTLASHSKRWPGLSCLTVTYLTTNRNFNKSGWEKSLVWFWRRLKAEKSWRTQLGGSTFTRRVIVEKLLGEADGCGKYMVFRDIFTSQWHVSVCALFEGRIVDRPEHLRLSPSRWKPLEAGSSTKYTWMRGLFST
jgi:hypothetical protein